MPSDHFISRYCKEHGFELTAKSLIRIEILPAQFPKCDWVFFSSGNSAKSYFENNGPTNAKFAAMGSGTASIASRYCKLDFVGSGSPKTVALAFREKIGSAKVCFPISDQSVRSIQKSLGQDQVIDVVSYSTQSLEGPLPQSDAYLFTSPSNVNESPNKLSEDALLIAIGPTTAKSLGSHAIQPLETTVLGMIDLLQRVF